ncbi:NrdJb [Candidatus Colwellia aromaticivorans]|uniref:NrdJb n=1 Tax=Candidatus Colwellia aromaticivorans TaxID=2267621 RepID=UPI000DF43D08|nr:NrdJb [Candidatus Colwellia aromaticivorans]
MTHSSSTTKPIEISKKIIGVSVLNKESSSVSAIEKEAKIVELIEKTKRPIQLDSRTYKIKASSGYDHAYYVSISNVVLNEGTELEEVRPYEIFINTKDKISVQWVHALTFMMSAIFRKGGEYMFLLDELREVSSSNAGWFGQHTRGGNPRYIESMVSAIADTIAYHVEQTCGVAIKKIELSSEAKEIIEEKKAEYLKKHTSSMASPESVDEDAGMPNALDCSKCKVRNTVIKLDGCLTCVSCADSKCG